MNKEEKELIFTRLNQLQDQIDDIEYKQNRLIKRLQNMIFKRRSE